MDFDILFDAGITQGEFAQIVGVSRVTVNMWSKGKTIPNRFRERKIQRVLAAVKSALGAKKLPIDEKHGRIPLLKRVIANHLTD